MNLEQAVETVAADAPLQVDWELVETCLFQMCPKDFRVGCSMTGPVLNKSTLAAKGWAERAGAQGQSHPTARLEGGVDSFSIHSTPAKISHLFYA